MARHALRNRLLLGVFAILVPVLGLLLFGFVQDHRRRSESVISDLRDTTSVAGMLVERALEDALGLARVLAVERRVLELSRDELLAQFGRILAARPEFINLLFIDERGTLVAAGAGTPASDLPFAQRDFFRRVVSTGEPVLSGVLMGRILGQPIIVAAAPVAGDAGEVKGVVVVAVSLRELSRRLRETDLREGLALFVTDPSGRLAFHTARADPPWDERDLSSVPEVRRAAAGEVVETTELEAPLLGRGLVATLERTARYGWVVGASWPRESAYAPLERRLREELALFGVIALVSLLGAAAVASYLARPVHELAAHARALGGGELSRRVELRTGDELEELGRAFNDMAGALQDERRRRELFIAAIAHDLKNVLTPLLLGAQGLRVADVPAERRERMIATVLERIRRIDRLVGDLLDTSRIEAGRFEIEKAPFDLAAVARRVAEDAQLTTETHRITVSAPPSLELEGDADRIAQVLGNLLSNAVKYSPDGGEIRLDVAARERAVEVSVRDEGVGLPPDELEQIFEPYRRLATDSRIRGLGLGLFVCRAIVEAHGGRIEAHSEGAARGATFRFTLPRAA